MLDPMTLKNPRGASVVDELMKPKYKLLDPMIEKNPHRATAIGALMKPEYNGQIQ